MEKKVSINDIAKLAEVSRGTVSRAFNDRSDINKKTREKVLSIAAELNYLPNQSARGLAKGTTESIGIIIPNFDNPFLTELVTEIERHARAENFSSLLSISHSDEKLQNKILLKMASGQVDGIVITPVEADKSVETINRISKVVPVVAMKNFEQLNCDTVMGDDILGVKIMTEHLISEGHQNVAFIVPAKQASWTVRARVQEFNRFIETGKLTNGKIMEIPSIEENYIEKLKNSLREIIKSKDSPTAFFAYDDIIALRTIHILKSEGYQIPKDFSVAGFDNISFSEISETPLSSISGNLSEIAENAVELLMKRIECSRKKRKQAKKKTRLIKPTLFIRQSSSSSK